MTKDWKWYLLSQPSSSPPINAQGAISGTRPINSPHTAGNSMGPYTKTGPQSAWRSITHYRDESQSWLIANKVFLQIWVWYKISYINKVYPHLYLYIIYPTYCPLAPRYLFKQASLKHGYLVPPTKPPRGVATLILFMASSAASAILAPSTGSSNSDPHTSRCSHSLERKNFRH